MTFFHLLFIGYHGCSKETAEEILTKGVHLNPSDEEHDWLGTGIYFWENDYNRALQWAQDKAKRDKDYGTPYVLGACLDLGRCMDLLTIEHNNLLQKAFQLVEHKYEQGKDPFPDNEFEKHGVPLLRYRDRLVINAARDIADDLKIPFDSVRGCFWEGAETFPGAAFTEKTHIQLSVQNQCVLGYFRPHQLMSKRTLKK